MSKSVLCQGVMFIESGQGLSPVGMSNKRVPLLFSEIVRCLVPLIEVKAGCIN